MSIRTNRDVKSGRNDLTFIKEYVVMVVDSAGQAKSDVQITPSVDLSGLLQGPVLLERRLLGAVDQPGCDREVHLDWTAWTGSGGSEVICPNEDVNRNGVREAGTFVAGSASPSLDCVRKTSTGTAIWTRASPMWPSRWWTPAKTDSNGLAVVQIEYGKNLATWVKYVITVTASGVSGQRRAPSLSVFCRALRRGHCRDDPAVVRAQPLRHRHRLHEPRLSA